MRRNIIIFSCVCLAIVGLISPPSFACSSYQSFHEYPKEILYRNINGNLSSEMRQGYRALADMNDTKILCQRGYECPDSVVPQVTNTYDVRGSSKCLRFFIPPGTYYYTMKFFFPRDTLLHLYMRFGQPPDVQYSGYNDLVQFDIPILGYGLNDLANGDRASCNMGGHANLVNVRLQDPIREDQAGWLYVKIKVFHGSLNSYRVNFINNVKLDPYLAWYNSMTDYHWDNEFDEFVNYGSGSGDSGSSTGGNTTNPGGSTGSGDSNTGDSNTGNTGDDGGDSPIFGGPSGGVTNPSTNNPTTGGDTSDGWNSGSGGSSSFPVGEDYSSGGGDTWTQNPSTGSGDSGSQTGDSGGQTGGSSPIFGGPNSGDGGDDSSNSGNTDEGDTSGTVKQLPINARKGLASLESNIVNVECDASCRAKIFKPVVILNVDDIQLGAEYDAYSAFIRNGVMYLAKLNYQNQIDYFFKSHKDPYVEYGSETIDTSIWQPAVFDHVDLDAAPFNIQDEIIFYLGLVPQGSNNLERDVVGAAFKLTP